MTRPLPPYCRDELVAELTAAGAMVRGNAVQCPFHDDKHASGHLTVNDQGKWRYKCHAPGCSAATDKAMDLWDVRAKLTGKPLDQVLAEAAAAFSGRQPERNPVKTYTLDDFRHWNGVEEVNEYTNPDTGEVEFVTVRYVKRGETKKSFAQAVPHGDGRFAFGNPPRGKWPLFNRTRVRNAESVLVVEGEKCVRALHAIGIVATTAPGGAGEAEGGGTKARYADWSPLAGKTVYLWPDNDANGGGQAYMDDVATILHGLDNTPSVYLCDIEPLCLPNKGDVVDYLESLADDRIDFRRLAVNDVLGDAKAVGGSAFDRYIRDVAAGKYRVLKTGFRDLDYLSKALMAGTVTIVCGSGGSGKSFWVIQVVAVLTRNGHKVAIYELEDRKATHMSRLAAQEAGDPRVLDPDWAEENISTLEEYRQAHKDVLDAVDKHMDEGPAMPPSYEEILAWVRAKSDAGYPVIVIDPITAMKCADQPWAADQDFLMRAKAIVRDSGARLVLVTHPKSGTKKPSMDALAGGMAYNRFPHTILWLEFMAKTEKLEIDYIGLQEVNRKLHMVKTRNGPGMGLTLGCMFLKGTSLKLEEKGVLAQ